MIAGHAAPLDGRGMGGLLSSITRPVGELLEGVRDLATLKPFRKGLTWAWGHMGADMRALVMTIGPMVADFYLPGVGGKLSKVALSVLENERMSKAQRKAAKKAMAEAIATLEASGELAPGLIDVDNPEHLQALALAGAMPPGERAAWFRSRGLAPAGAPVAAQGAAAAGLLALSVLL